MTTRGPKSDPNNLSETEREKHDREHADREPSSDSVKDKPDGDNQSEGDNKETDAPKAGRRGTTESK